MATPSTGSLELIVLLSVARLGDDAYGAQVRRDVSLRTGREYSVGAMYATLQRLEDKGLLRSRMSEPIAVRGGRARRSFRLTSAGVRALARARRETHEAWSGVDLRPDPV